MLIATVIVVLFAPLTEGSLGGQKSAQIHPADGGGSVNASIVGGVDASQCEWKWQVSLRRFGSHYCGGTLISEQWVLTAAHCINFLSPDEVDVVAGAYKIDHGGDQNEQVVDSLEFHLHPCWDDWAMDYDFGLIKLASKLTTNNCVSPAGLPSHDVDEGTQCWITGWGTTSFGGTLANTLQEASVSVFSGEYCRDAYGHSDISEAMLCAGKTNGGVDSCQGDSGGPLVCPLNNELRTVYGVTSWGYGCAEPGYPGVYARVFIGLDWINATLAGNDNYNYDNHCFRGSNERV